MADDPKSIALYKEAIVKIDAVDKARKATQPKYEDLKKRIAGAIKSKAESKLELYRSALEAVVSEIAKGSNKVDLAHGAMREVELDEEFAAGHVAAIDKLTDILEAGQKSFDAMFKDAKKLQNDIEAALASAEDVATLARRALARLQKRADDDRETLKKLFARSDALAQKADEAKETHKKPVLAAAQKAYADLLVEPALFLHGKLIEELAAFAVEAGLPKYGPELQAELKDGIKDIQVQMAGVRIYVEQLDETSKRVKEMTVEEIDMKQAARKAAKLLALDRAREDEMAKAFERDVPERRPGRRARQDRRQGRAQAEGQGHADQVAQRQDRHLEVMQRGAPSVVDAGPRAGRSAAAPRPPPPVARRLESSARGRQHRAGAGRTALARRHADRAARRRLAIAPPFDASFEAIARWLHRRRPGWTMARRAAAGGEPGRQHAGGGRTQRRSCPGPGQFRRAPERAQ